MILSRSLPKIILPFRDVSHYLQYLTLVGGSSDVISIFLSRISVIFLYINIVSQLLEILTYLASGSYMQADLYIKGTLT